MEEHGIKPTTYVVSKVGDVFQKLGIMDKYDKLNRKYPPPKWEYQYFKGKHVKVLAKQPENDVDKYVGETASKDNQIVESTSEF